MSLAFRYAAFAGIATMLNILAQDVTTRLYDGTSCLYVSMFVGTLTGLLFKYFMDKRYIFYYSATNLTEDGQKFVLYSCMGILTTLFFWGVELLFEYYFHTKGLRYLGGVIGLSIGYWIKYQLDKHFVFVGRTEKTRKRTPESHGERFLF